MALRLEQAGKQGVIYGYAFDAYWPGGTKNTAWFKNVTGLLTEVASVRLATPIYVHPTELAGHTTRVVHTGPAALAAAREFRPEVVLLDIGLPGLNGYEVARRLRSDPELAGALLVALTGWGSEDDKRQALDAGFDVHLTKPIEATALDAAIARVHAVG